MESLKLPVLEIENHFLQDAKELQSARERAKSIHKGKDIRSAGNEVEIPVRNFFVKKLSTAFYVGHGHIVDSTLSQSPQLDVIISDNSRTPVLLTNEDKTEYIPYECVYAIGEAKSTYRTSDKQIEEFIDKIKTIHTGLQREKVPKQLAGGVILPPELFKSNIAQPYRNPLFSFMVFVDATDLDFGDVAALYNVTPIEYLPTVICFLNKGTLCSIYYSTKTSKPEPISINIHPLFISDMNPDDATHMNKWTLFPVAGNFGIGHSLGLLCLALLGHLDIAYVYPAKLQIYLNQMFLKSQPPRIDILNL